MTKQPTTIIRLVFSVVGALLCGIALLLYQHTSAFIASASRTRGEVLRLLHVESSKSNSSGTWKPLVRFKAPGGEIIEFTPSSSSNPPAYDVGEKVDVFFDPRNPQDAMLNGFFSLWGGAVITGGIGARFPARRGGDAVPACAGAGNAPTARVGRSPTTEGAALRRSARHGGRSMKARHNNRPGENMSLSFILLIVLILILIGALPSWGYSRAWGYGPSGGVGLVVLIVVILVLMGRI